MTTNPAAFEMTLDLADQGETEALGRELALFLSAGDWVGLGGDLGAGKTTLARAVIRALDERAAAIDVPSPTFTLIQLYDDLRVPVAHCDLYRLEDASEIDELGLEDIEDNHICLIEWPDRLAGRLPADRLTLELSVSGAGRRAVLAGHGNWAGRLERLRLVRRFIAAGQFAGADRSLFQGDASSRRYERLTLPDGRCCLLMDMPDAPDGPPIRDGRPYSSIAHIATGIRSVVAVNGELTARGFSAPQTLACDLGTGLALIEYLQGQTFYDLIKAGEDTSQCLLAAVTVLAEMAGQAWPDAVTLADGSTYTVSPFDRDAFAIEAELLLDWFWPAATGTVVSDADRTAFTDIWSDLYRHVDTDAKVWLLRDFHSPNLIWLPQRQGLGRVGLIDTQDALLGHAAYDLVSLLQDARIDIPRDVEEEMLDYYCAWRQAAAQETSQTFDDDGFRRAYAVLGAQRATKVLGIFVRLAERDGKPGYLRHIDRVSTALERNLAHPALVELKAWYDARLPQNLRKQLVAGR